MNKHHAPREKGGQYQPKSGAGQRVKESMQTRMATMPKSMPKGTKGCK